MHKNCRRTKIIYLVCSIEQINESPYAPTVADGGLVSLDLSKLSQSSHYIDQDLFRLISQQTNQHVQSFVLLEALKEQHQEEMIALEYN